MFGRSRRVKRDALSCTPAEFDLAGKWTVHTEVNDQPITGIAVLEQSGVSVTGFLQWKFATLPFVELQGLLCDSQLNAVWWRAEKAALGSGRLTLGVNSDATELRGTSTWHSDRDVPVETLQHRWVRIQ